MSEKSPFKFRGFLSYSRRDAKEAKKLHRRLERYQIPKSLRSVAKKTLGRFFRDKEELAASSELKGELTENLDESQWLIVCCSPEAAASKWVNAEIEHVIQTRGRDAVLAVILEGEPEAVFPPALQDLPPLAADFRPQGDGQDIGFLKLVAGILNVDLGELRDREAAAQRRRARLRSALVTLFALLAIAASVSAYLAIQQRDRAEKMALEAIDIGAGVVDKAGDLSRTYQVPTEAVEEMLTFAEERFERLFAAGAKDPELERRRAQLLLSFASVAKRTGDVAAQRRYAETAIEQMASLVERGEGIPGHYTQALMTAGQAALAQGDETTGMKHLEGALSIARASYHDRDDTDLHIRHLYGRALYEMAMAKLANQDGAAARPLLEEAVPLFEANRNEAPDDEIHVTNLIVSLDLLGGAQALDQDREAALATLERAIDQGRTWVEIHPGSLTARTTLATSLTKLAQLRLDSGNAPGAVSSYLESIALTRELAEIDPGNAELQNNLSLRLVLGAQALQTVGDLDRAAEFTNEGIALTKNSIAADPTNVGLKNTYLSMLDAGYGTASQRNDAPGMLAIAREQAALRGDLRTLLGDSTARKTDHAYALERVGDASAANRNLEGMLEAYGAAAPLRRELLAEDPQSIDARTALAGTLHALGLSHKFAKQSEAALEALGQAAELRSGLAEQDPGNRDIAFAASDSFQQLAIVQAGIDGAASLASLESAEALLAKLVEAHPDHAAYQESLKKTRDILQMIRESLAPVPESALSPPEETSNPEAPEDSPE
tara:strand:- start:24931 stop:27270 length:2340 start_codon:yes stop_codon:yes gene_type:complete